MPITIITGAGDSPKRSNGAPGRATPRPQRFRLLKPKLIRMTDAAASTTPTMSIPTSDRPSSGFSRKLRKKTMPETTIRSPNTGRQPMNVPSRPPIRNAVTPAAARAEPSAPTAVACCRP
jgi:hypothetical protein